MKDLSWGTIACALLPVLLVAAILFRAVRRSWRRRGLGYDNDPSLSSPADGHVQAYEAGRVPTDVSRYDPSGPL
jgi:hypothetical protein